MHYAEKNQSEGNGCLYLFIVLVALIFGFIWYDISHPEPIPFTSGFIVSKRYIPQHMSNKDVPEVSEAVIIPVFHPVVPAHRAPTLVKASFTVWLANRNGVTAVKVDSLRYYRLKVGQRWKVKLMPLDNG